jgi:DNA-binding NtrC family response regulator
MVEDVEQRVVLVVDDDVVQRTSLLRVLQGLGYRATTAEDGEQALEVAAQDDVAVAIVDLNLPQMHGYEVIRRLRQQRPNLECVVLTGEKGVGVADEARANGASDYFEKPIRDMSRFQQVIRRSFEVHGLRKKIDQQGTRTHKILGVSPAMARVRDLIERMAGSNAPVLITGESGVGKEVVAEGLHERSNARGEFIRINCAAVPESLIEVELFGAEEGSFTGQRGAREGLLGLARNGTLFLDEIGDMPLALQPKLLRALQSRTYRPIGARAERELTARVVSATNVDLDKAAAKGKFRQDLFFRLAVLRIDVPPLRERMEDAPILLAHFLRQHALAEGRQVPRLTSATTAQLLTHSWPGNVRELGNAALRAVIMAGPEVVWDDFGLDRNPQQAASVGSTGSPGAFEEWLDVPLGDAKTGVLRTFTQWYIREHLRRTGGNITQAAESSGMQRPNFKREMRKYGVEVED